MIEITRTSSPVGSPANEAVSPEYRAKAAEAAEKFEAHFIAQMFKQIRRTTHEMSDDEGSFAKRANDDMLEVADTLVADSIAHQRAFGIADVLLRQVLPQAAEPITGALKESELAAASLNEEPQPELSRP